MNMRPIDFAASLLDNASLLNPPVTSLTDVDFYKFPMVQFIYQNYRGTKVTFKLIIRDKDIPVGRYVSEERLRDCLDLARDLYVTSDERQYLRNTEHYGKGLFKEDYLDFLRTFRLPPYRLEKNGDDIELTFRGPWVMVSMWETIALAIISELYYRSLLLGMSGRELEVMYARAQERIRVKLETLLLHPTVRFSDFGQRRRHSFLWQGWVIGLCKEMMGAQFLGTSNTRMAAHYGVSAIGTNAHELPMVVTALADTEEEKRSAQFKLLQKWEEMYGQGLRIMLPDTFTSQRFFENVPPKFCEWSGVRQDSGDPVAFGERYISWLEHYGIDPKEKTIIFSDGLDVAAMVGLEKHFRGRIKTVFGWGTLLTNDFRDCIPGNKLLRPFSMVCKVVEVNGRPCVKLSDNPNKATGPAEEVARYKKIFNVGSQTAQVVIV